VLSFHNYLIATVDKLSWRMRLVGHVTHMGEMRSVCKLLAVKSEGKGPLRRPRHKWEGNIRMDFRVVG
jgi:hypothetical protein